ncbi:MAG: 23S rRNA (uracil(1939)-C(5))-methyltransferase RlmD [Deltaproteobacteria bacterium]
MNKLAEHSLLNKNDAITVEITDMSFPDGYGVAKHEGLVVFVPDCVPGDIAEIRIVKNNKNLAYGELLKIETPSLYRVTPACPHSDICGGCTMQNLSYEKQLHIKENYLKESLKRIGRIDIENISISSIVPSPDIHFYRNKIELAFGEDGHGIILGMRKRVPLSGKYAWDVTPLMKCDIFSSIIQKIIPLFISFAHKNYLSAYNPLNGKGFLRHLILREAKSTGNIMAVIETTKGKLPDTTELWQNLVQEIPNIKSLYRIINDKPGDVIHYERSSRFFGESYITESMGDTSFRIYPESFFQPNPRAAHLLYARLAEFVQQESNNGKVLGLYCGTGPIEIFLSQYAKEVIGVDSSHTNITTAKENCRMNRIENCAFHEGRVENVLKTLPLSNVDLLVVDPPREGISKDGLALMFTIKPKTIAYISCNPSTLSRDLKEFIGQGYAIAEIAPFDFFPHTSHMETLAILGR